jgi:hypothetical protein
MSSTGAAAWEVVGCIVFWFVAVFATGLGRDAVVFRSASNCFSCIARAILEIFAFPV